MVCSSRKSFTLIELLLVIAVTAILFSVVIIALNSARIRARDARVVSDLAQMRRLMELYTFENNQGYMNFAGSGAGSPAIMCCSDSTAMFCQPTSPIPQARPCQNLVNLPDETKKKAGTLAQDILQNTNSTFGLRMVSSVKGALAVAPIPSAYNAGQPTSYTCVDSYGNNKTYGSVLNTYQPADPFWAAWDNCRTNPATAVCACP